MIQELIDIRSQYKNIIGFDFISRSNNTIINEKSSLRGTIVIGIDGTPLDTWSIPFHYNFFIPTIPASNDYANNIEGIYFSIPLDISFLKEILFVDNLKYKLIEMQEKESINKILDYLFESLENKLLNNEFDVCNKFLETIDIYKYDINILIGILTITNPWKNRLIYRVNFFNRLTDLVYNNYPSSEAEEILSGLE